ncbi:caspase-like isoform X2 [Drosophila hydei]|uniref:Caspase-like isoform X1 n=1 Tax=Drosophila hydei TaxID=7224 RepID=A0A6J1LMD2_DROHY|nr:caspase-like isoform X1 [Drosophila hydei]XP_030080300.1 caspase-like isoform X2 [Drosophila hydei]
MCDNGKSYESLKGEQETSNDISNVSPEDIDGACISVNAQMVIHRHDVEYKMSHTHRGPALIFSHEHFNYKNLPSRPETNIDSKNLKCVLKKLGFNVKVYKDSCYKELNKTIENAVAADHTNHDCILIAVLTHGDSDTVYAKDGEYQLKSIWESFKAEKCPSLAGKPKLFIVQACQGKLRDPGYVLHSKGHTETDSVSNSSYKIPNYADFLIAFCTIPNYRSWSNTSTGSWFIYNLCEELEANGKTLDMLNLLTFVAQRVANCESYEYQAKQISFTMSTLTRVLRFGSPPI